MSANQKQAGGGGGGPQTQRYNATHYLPITTPQQQQRADAFHMTTSGANYVQQQQQHTNNQGGNQGPTLRAIAPTGPPNQASTPPTNDLKVQSVPQQQFMNHMYLQQPQQQQQVRGSQPPTFRPTTTNSTPRMPNQTHRGMNQFLPPTSPQFVPLPVYVNTTIPPYVQRSYIQSQLPMFQPSLAGNYTFPSNAAQTQNLQYYYNPQLGMPRPSHPPQVSAAPTANPNQQLQNLPMSAPPAQPLFARPQNKQRRPNALPIIDPDTGVDRSIEIYKEDENTGSHPPSGESSARQTPQPSNQQHSKEVQAVFAKQVAQVIGNDVGDESLNKNVVLNAGATPQPQSLPNEHHLEPSAYMHSNQPPSLPPSQQPQHQPPLLHHLHQMQQQAPPLQQPQPTPPPQQRIEHLVQSSTLTANAKEFVLGGANANSTANLSSSAAAAAAAAAAIAKEPPVVSANCDGVEITLPCKTKERESPAKGRKQMISGTASSAAVLKQSSCPTGLATMSKDKEQGHNEEKRGQKRETKSYTKTVSASAGDAPLSTPIASATTAPTLGAPHDNAKSKQNAAQRTKDYQKTGGGGGGNSSQPQSQQQSKQMGTSSSTITTTTNTSSTTAIPPVPQPQPAKAHSKTSKKTEINQKGASKEGTDMDAFNDNNTSTNITSSTTSSNLTINSNSATNDILNANLLSNNNAVVAAANTTTTTTTQAIGASNGNNNSNLNMTTTNNKNNVAGNANVIVVNNNNNNNNNDATILRSKNINVANNAGSNNSCNDMINQSATNVLTSQISSNVAVSQTSTINNGGSSSNNNSNRTAIETTKTLPKRKYDITSIVKDSPKPLKAFTTTLVESTTTTVSAAAAATTGTDTTTTATAAVAATLPPTAQSSDETDRAVVLSSASATPPPAFGGNDAIKSDGGLRTIDNGNSTTGGAGVPAAGDIRLMLPYKEGQWRPDKQDGKKVYEREFLLALKNFPASRVKPEHVPEYILVQDRHDGGRFPIGGRPDFTTPHFANYGGKSSSQRGIPPKRNSQSGKQGGSGTMGQKSCNKPSGAKVSISVREEVKLHEAENAWRPERLKKAEEDDESKKKTEQLYKRVRGVLNKLTPQKFDTLLSQVRSLEIDTADRLQGVINLVFEKAVDEPNFSKPYALMCRELALMHVSGNGNPNDEKDSVNFRKLLLNRCQTEFEKQSHDESLHTQKMKEIDNCTDPEKRKELRMELEEYHRKLRMKSVGNIRFIGELFKQDMLTVKIMLRCLSNLLENKDEESLECLCKLLTTIGKELERGKNDLSSYFATMKELADRKHGNISSRVRFMLQDVIDLRRAKWVPRRQDLNPKTIDQIQKEAENEQMNIQVSNSMPPMMQKRDDGRGLGGSGGGGASGSRGSSVGGGSGGGSSKRSNMSEDGWQLSSTRGRSIAFNVQTDKLKNKLPMADEPLGSRQQFGRWGCGSNIKNDPSSVTNTANAYAVLENMDSDKRSISSRGKDAYHSKGPSLERNYKQSYEGRGSRSDSRSGSQHRNIDSGLSSQRNTSSSVLTSAASRSTPAPLSSASALSSVAMLHSSSSVSGTISPLTTNVGGGAATAAAPTPAVKLTEEQLQRRIANDLDEYINESLTLDLYIHDLQAMVPQSYFKQFVADGYLHVLERSQTARLRTGYLMANLINSRVITTNDYFGGLEEVLSQADDLTIDIPKIWDYLAELIVHPVCEMAVTLKGLHRSFDVLIKQEHAPKLLAPLFRLIITEKGPELLRKCWQSSGLSLADFMPTSQVDNFIKTNKLEFLSGGDTPIGQCDWNYSQIKSKLLEFFDEKAPLDSVVNWIMANVGQRVKENEFIITLMTAILENSISNNKLVSTTFCNHHKLLLKYVDNNPTYELQCLIATQALMHKMEYPPGLLLSIFSRLYEDSLISQESFLLWEQNVGPAEYKGVALLQLTAFFTQLKEPDVDGSTSEDEAPNVEESDVSLETTD